MPSPLTPAQARDQIGAAGLRLTAPRIAILRAIAALPGHVTADDVRIAAAESLGSVSQQTVYDGLRTLAGAGLIRATDAPGHPARFEFRVGDNHHHFVCRSCGDIQDVDCIVGSAPCIEGTVGPGVLVDEAAVTYRGYCAACTPSRSGRSDRPSELNRPSEEN